MTPGQSPLTLAALVLATLAMAGSIGIELGLIRSPFEAVEPPKPGPPPRAAKKQTAVAKPSARHETRPAEPIEIVHAEEAEPAPMPIAERPAKQSAPNSMPATEADPELAARRWRVRLGLLHRRMHTKGVDADSVARKAVDELNQLDDPRVAPLIWRAFAGHPQHHLLVARRLAALISPASSRMLAALAVYSPEEKARAAAVAGLDARDAVDFAGPLIALLGPELKCRASVLPTTPGAAILRALEVEDERFIRQFVYFAEPIPTDPASAFGGCGAMPTEFDQTRAGLTQELADLQLQSDVQAVAALNLRIRTVNDRAGSILARAAGRDFGLDRDAWSGWLAAKSGKTYVAPEQVAKIPFQQFVEPIYVPTFVETPPVPS